MRYTNRRLPLPLPSRTNVKSQQKSKRLTTQAYEVAWSNFTTFTVYEDLRKLEASSVCRGSRMFFIYQGEANVCTLGNLKLCEHQESCHQKRLSMICIFHLTLPNIPYRLAVCSSCRLQSTSAPRYLHHTAFQ